MKTDDQEGNSRKTRQGGLRKKEGGIAGQDLDSRKLNGSFNNAREIIFNNYSLKSPLFTEIEKNNRFSIYTGSDFNNIFRRKPLKIDLIDLLIHAFTPTILFLFSLRIIHSVGGE